MRAAGRAYATASRAVTCCLAFGCRYSWFDPGARTKDGLCLRRPTNERAQGWGGLWGLFKEEHADAAAQMVEGTFKAHGILLLAAEYAKILGCAKDHNCCSVCKLVSTKMLQAHQTAEGYRQEQAKYAPGEPAEDAVKYVELTKKLERAEIFSCGSSNGVAVAAEAVAEVAGAGAASDGDFDIPDGMVVAVAPFAVSVDAARSLRIRASASIARKCVTASSASKLSCAHWIMAASRVSRAPQIHSHTLRTHSADSVRCAMYALTSASVSATFGSALRFRRCLPVALLLVAAGFSAATCAEVCAGAAARSLEDSV